MTTTENQDGGAYRADPFAQMDPDMARHPQPTYKVMRDTMPVMRVDGVGVVISRRADIEEAFRHPDLFSSNMSAVDLSNVRPMIPLQIDPPEHKNYRRILDPLFAPKQMKLLEEAVTELVNELIDAFVDQEEIDFATQFSVPFPSQVFLTLLGLPLEDLHLFLKMKDGIIRPQHVTGAPMYSKEAKSYQREIANSIYEYFDRVLDEREAERRDDLLSHFLDAEVEGRRLTREDILDICFLFLIAGLDTVTASLDCFFAYLAEHPGQRARIAANPELIPTAVEELLRWETPVMGVARVATRDTEISGCPVHQGDNVMVMLGSANTDEDEFPDADEVVLDREANRHLAFGGGVHRCLGSHLARLELRVALREWHARIPDYEIAPGAELVFTPGVRAADSFPMRIRPRR
ncbi:MAG TPA: cytochrome P450 [Acidimicrobiales bacterium]|nr:cytochrome P450 [Acidimicrobiales bacterium]